MSSVIAVTTDRFELEVIEADRPVLVDFYAPWCGPCRLLGPVLEQLAGEFAGRASIVKVNVDDEPELAATFGVRAVPTMCLFSGGELLGTIPGLVPAAALRGVLERACKDAGRPAQAG